MPRRPKPTRVNYLNEAARLTSGDRDREYGHPSHNLTNCALLISAYLEGKFSGHPPTLSAEDIAWLNVLQKMARTFSGHVKPDTYIDAACYAAIAGECAQEEAPE